MQDERLVGNAVQMLSDTPLFGKLSPDALECMLAACTPFVLQKTETIGTEETQEFLYILVNGRLKVTQVDPNTGRSIALFLLGSGDIYDLFSLLDGREHIAFPIAMERLTTLRVPITQVRNWLCEYPAFNEAFLSYVGTQLRRTESFAESIVFEDTLTRLTRLIIEHTMPKNHPDDDHYPVRLIHNLSHESLAEMIGSVRSVVTSQMRKLKSQGLIKSRRGYLSVVDLEALFKKIDPFYR